MDKLQRPLIIISLAFIIRMLYAYNNQILNLVSVSAAVLISIIILITYLILNQTTKSQYAILFSIFLLAIMNLGFDVPVITSFSELLFLISVIFALATLYGMLNLNKKQWYLLLVFPLLSAYFHFSALLVIPTLTLFLAFLALEHYQIERREVYFLAISTVIILLVVFAFHSITDIINNLFWFQGDLSYLLGAYPIYFGIFGAYYAIKHKNELGVLFLGLASSTLIAMFLGFTGSRTVFYLLLALAVLSSRFITYVLDFLKITKIKHRSKEIMALIFIISVLLGIPSWIIS